MPSMTDDADLVPGGAEIADIVVGGARHQLHAVLDEGATAMDDIFPLDDAG
jgi:hypothetical protein